MLLFLGFNTFARYATIIGGGGKKKNSNIYVNTCCQTTNNVHNSTFPFFNLSRFTKENGATINNEDRKEFQVLKNAKIYSVL